MGFGYVKPNPHLDVSIILDFAPQTLPLCLQICLLRHSLSTRVNPSRSICVPIRFLLPLQFRFHFFFFLPLSLRFRFRFLLVVVWSSIRFRF
ncbi:hypothetical protein IC582_010566 [Cucumis melo]